MKIKVIEKYLAIKNVDDNIDRLIDMGYSTELFAGKGGPWIFIVIYNNDIYWKSHKSRYGKLVFGLFDCSTDIELDIESVPLLEDLNDYVKMLDEGEKMGLL